MEQVAQSTRSLRFFIRFSALGGTVILPLLGVATIVIRPDVKSIVSLLVVGVAWHCFAYVTNDIFDLDLDRTEPRRAGFPLVRGTITVRQALICSLVQIPLMFAVTAFWSGDLNAYLYLGVSIISITVYNKWGKRAFFPPLTDAVQGVAWGTLAVYGALAIGGEPTIATWVLFAYVFVFILLANGIHGSVRDLTNDLRFGVRSTAILMGARPSQSQGLIIPHSLRSYALILTIILICLALIPVALNWYDYPQSARIWTTSVLAVLSALCLVTIVVAARSATNPRDTYAAGMINVLLLLLILIAMFVPAMDRNLLIVVVSFFVFPLLSHSWFFDALRWGIRLGKVS